MAKHQKTFLKDAARGLIGIDLTKLSADERHIIRRAYAICSQQLFKKTGKHFMELEHPNPTEKYIT